VTVADVGLIETAAGVAAVLEPEPPPQASIVVAKQIPRTPTTVEKFLFVSLLLEVLMSPQTMAECVIGYCLSLLGEIRRLNPEALEHSRRKDLIPSDAP
jgi:hypothetical protein